MGELMCPACRHAKRKHGKDGCDAVNGSCWCDMTPEMIDGSAPVPAPNLADLPPLPPKWSAPLSKPAAAPEPAPATAEAASIEVEVTDDDREAARVELAASQRATQEMRETDDVDEDLEDDPYGEGRDDWHDDDQDDPLGGIGSQYIADPVERITELAKIAPEYVRPVGEQPAAPEVLGRWDSWWCGNCGARRFESFDCCGSAAVPVTLTMTSREADRG